MLFRNPKNDDYTNTVIGDLLVEERDPVSTRKNIVWKCTCLCGTSTLYSTATLKSGVVSCGCKPPVFLTKGLVISRTPTKSFKLLRRTDTHGSTREYWECECSCGEVFEAFVTTITSGKVECCGTCNKKHERTTPVYQKATALKYLFGNVRKGAKDRGYSFNITFEDFLSYIFEPCYYCGEIGVNSKRIGKSDDFIQYNGLDRVDNSKGYSRDNIVTCCKHCNHMKRDSEQDEFFLRVQKIFLRNKNRHLEPL